MFKDDQSRLRHMLDGAREALASIGGRVRADMERDHIWMLGLVKCVEIIGEAAARIGEDTRKRFPQIPWAQIIAMRNRLVHVYFDIDPEQVWKAVTEDLPPLVAELERILEKE